jgi:hypothetical protein
MHWVYSFGVITKTPTKDRTVKVARSVIDVTEIQAQLDVQQQW